MDPIYFQIATPVTSLEGLWSHGRYFCMTGSIRLSIVVGEENSHEIFPFGKPWNIFDSRAAGKVNWMIWKDGISKGLTVLGNLRRIMSWMLSRVWYLEFPVYLTFFLRPCPIYGRMPLDTAEIQVLLSFSSMPANRSRLPYINALTHHENT